MASKTLPDDGRVTDIDGLRIDFTDGFGLVRASNTTPSLVVRLDDNGFTFKFLDIR
jgi:phosphomannomutase/phosphoglucomutase